MIVIDHLNWRAKLLSLLALCCIFIMTALSVHARAIKPATALQTTQPTQTISTARSTAHFNPISGAFTSQPASIAPHHHAHHHAHPYAINRDHPRYRSSSTVSNTKVDAQSQEQKTAPYQGLRSYKNALVIPAPRALHSKLIAIKPSQAEIEQGQTTLRFTHEHNPQSMIPRS